MDFLKKINIKKYYPYLIIIIVSSFICIPLYQKGVHTGHDGDFHISRALGTVEQLLNGNSIFVISRFSNRLGYAWNLFYPPISTLVTVIFTFLTNNVVTAIKIFIYLAFICSGISMYKLVETISKNKIAALISSILYVIAPYNLLNIYTRLAVGEILSFVFIPIILKGVYLILEGKTKKSYIFTLGTIGLILSHNISALLTCIFGVFYVLINIDKLKSKKIITTLIISGILIVLSVLFFEVPLLEQKSSCEYEVFRYGKMYSNESVALHSLNPLQLLFRNADGADSSMYFCIGIPIILGLLLTPFVKKDISIKKNYYFLLIVGFISSIMSTSIFPWSIMPDILLMIQFPWRLLIFIVFTFSIIAGINFSLFIEKLINKIKDNNKITNIKILSIAVLILLSLLYSFSFIFNIDMEYKDNDFYRQEEIIDTVMEVSRYSSYIEYWPQKAARSIDYIVNRGNLVIINSGNATIKNEVNNNGVLDFEITNVEEKTSLELPYLFYKGYRVTYTPSNSKKTIVLNNHESDKGLVEISLDSSIDGSIHVEYSITPLHKMCIIISFTTIICYLLFLFFIKFKYKKIISKT